MKYLFSKIPLKAIFAPKRWVSNNFRNTNQWLSIPSNINQWIINVGFMLYIDNNK